MPGFKLAITCFSGNARFLGYVKAAALQEFRSPAVFCVPRFVKCTLQASVAT